VRCPFCHHATPGVIDSRDVDRARPPAAAVLPGVRRRFTTVEEAMLAVLKRSGVTEPFLRTR